MLPNCRSHLDPDSYRSVKPDGLNQHSGLLTSLAWAMMRIWRLCLVLVPFMTHLASFINISELKKNTTKSVFNLMWNLSHKSLYPSQNAPSWKKKRLEPYRKKHRISSHLSF